MVILEILGALGVAALIVLGLRWVLNNVRLKDQINTNQKEEK